MEAIMGYKATNREVTCNDYTFVPGRWHRHHGRMSICESGFHYCKRAVDVLDSYPKRSRFWTVSVRGKTESNWNKTKFVCREIKLVSELSWQQFLYLIHKESDREELIRTREAIPGNLKRCILRNIDLPGAYLYEANLQEADLHNTNLSEANLERVCLDNANLSKVNLYKATLSRANLYEANLCKANLYKTNFKDANISSADLSGANLDEANLHNASLCEANLDGASLCYADLRWADLYRARLRGADLRGANLHMTNFCEADLTGALLYPFYKVQNYRGNEYIEYKVTIV